MGKVDKLVGGVPHGRDNRDHLGDAGRGGGDTPGHDANHLSVSKGTAAVFLNDDRHYRVTSEATLMLAHAIYGRQIIPD